MTRKIERFTASDRVTEDWFKLALLNLPECPHPHRDYEYQQFRLCRNCLIYALSRSGYSGGEIGRYFGMTRQQVSNLLKAHYPKRPPIEYVVLKREEEE